MFRTISGAIYALAALAGAMGIIWRMLVIPLYRLFKRLEKAVDRVEAQLGNNHGATLRDAIDRIEEKQLVIDGRLTRVETYVKLLGKDIPDAP